METMHIPGKDHLDADRLSRLQTEDFNASTSEAPVAVPTTLSTRQGPRLLPAQKLARRDGAWNPPTLRNKERSLESPSAFSSPLDASNHAEIIQIDDTSCDRVVAALPVDPSLKEVYSEVKVRIGADTAADLFPTTTRESF
jgi:hypothetical protein